MSHTPAPWRVRPDTDWVVNDVGSRIATVDGEVPHSQMDANLLLIAAAPDLLVALEKIASGQFSGFEKQVAFAAIQKAKVLA